MTFQAKCAAIPPPGGAGCHPALLSAANAGVREDLSDEDIFYGIRESIPPGGRDVSDREIWDTIKTARADGGKPPKTVNRQFQTPPALMGPEFRQRLIQASPGATAEALHALSPVQIPPQDLQEQFFLFFTHSYQVSDLLYYGPEMSAHPDNIRSLPEVLATGPVYPKFVINPLSGHKATLANGTGTSYRCDNAVTRYPYALIEMDDIGVSDQVTLWTTIIRENLLPVQAVYYSGGKSLHALISTEGEVSDAYTWGTVIKERLFPRVMVPLGADKCCGNPSRFSRTPGATEDGRGGQYLIYLRKGA